MQEDTDAAIPYCIAVGDVRKLVHFFMARGQLKEALLVAQVQAQSHTRTSEGGRGRERVPLTERRPDGQSQGWPSLLLASQPQGLCHGHADLL